MTVQVRTEPASINYIVDTLNIGDVFNVNFKYLNDDETLTVFIRNNANDRIDLTLDVDYEVAQSDGTNGVWGTIKILKENKDVSNICIYRDIDVSQERTFTSQTIFSTTTEDALDKITMILQDDLESVKNRSLHVSVDDVINPGDLELPLAKDATGFVYRDETGKFNIGQVGEAAHALRQSFGEIDDPTFAMNKYERANNILGFDSEGSVRYVKPYTAGDNVHISDSNVISADETIYTAGDNISISPDKVISATDTTYSAGDNVQISPDNMISATDTKYTAGTNVEISSDNIISSTDTTYTAGTNVEISSDNVISSKDTTYTAGNNVQISSGNIISATDTTYTAGNGIELIDNQINATLTWNTLFGQRQNFVSGGDPLISVMEPCFARPSWLNMIGTQCYKLDVSDSTSDIAIAKHGNLAPYEPELIALGNYYTISSGQRFSYLKPWWNDWRDMPLPTFASGETIAGIADTADKKGYVFHAMYTSAGNMYFYNWYSGGPAIWFTAKNIVPQEFRTPGECTMFATVGSAVILKGPKWVRIDIGKAKITGSGTLPGFLREGAQTLFGLFVLTDNGNIYRISLSGTDEALQFRNIYHTTEKNLVCVSLAVGGGCMIGIFRSAESGRYILMCSSGNSGTDPRVHWYETHISEIAGAFSARTKIVGACSNLEKDGVQGLSRKFLIMNGDSLARGRVIEIKTVADALVIG